MNTMSKPKSNSRFLTWFMALTLSALAAGCGGGGDPILGIGDNVVAPATAPAVTVVAPLPNATAVPINIKIITAAFTKAMNPATLTAASFTLACPAGTPVTGTVAYLAIGNVATLTLPAASNLPINTVCTATVTTGARDTAGNALASNFVWSFTTSAVADTTGPTVTGTINALGTTTVAINTKVGATFSEAMDPSTITNTTFTLLHTLSGTAIAGTLSYSGVNVVFTPSANLNPDTNYTVIIKGGASGVKDLAGNALAGTNTPAGDFAWAWVTAGGADTTAPTVSGTIHTNGQANVAINTKVGATFSEAMDPLTITSANFLLQETATGKSVAGVVSYSGVNAVFIPLINLTPNTNYTVTIKGGVGGVTDSAGNPMSSTFQIGWTTAATADTTGPKVSATSNSIGATNVAINTKVGATFSEGMDPLTITNATFTLLHTLSGTAIAGAVSYSGVNAVFTPSSNLNAGTNYTAIIKGGAGGVKDLAGNALADGNTPAGDYAWAWVTAAGPDITAPTVIGTIHANGATNVAINTKVGATFSEAMDPLTVTNLNFRLQETVSSAAVAGTLSYSGLNALFTPLSNLKPSTNYTVTITGGAGGVRDLAGNPMLSTFQIGWTTAATADTSAPTVTLTNPANLAAGVALNSVVNATFSEAMDPLTITNANFTVAGVTGTVVYDAISRIATFTPASNLSANTTYTATITGAKDLAGNALAAGLVPNPWSFSTGTGLAPGAVALGSAASFGLMATSAITSTGLSVINGDVSLDPGTSMTGFPPGVVNGAVHVNDTVSAQARIDLLTAYNFAKGLPPGTTITAGADLGALYPLGIPPGTYTSGSTMLVSTPLVLDAGGNANAVWVFQIGSSLTTGASISLANGAQAKNVFWVPTLDATVGVGTVFFGSIVSGRDVTAVTGATINGRILAGATTAGTIALQTSTVNVPAP